MENYFELYKRTNLEKNGKKRRVTWSPVKTGTSAESIGLAMANPLLPIGT